MTLFPSSFVTVRRVAAGRPQGVLVMASVADGVWQLYSIPLVPG